VLLGLSVEICNIDSLIVLNHHGIDPVDDCKKVPGVVGNVDPVVILLDENCFSIDDCFVDHCRSLWLCCVVSPLLADITNISTCLPKTIRPIARKSQISPK